jgi:hypothetical protein
VTEGEPEPSRAAPTLVERSLAGGAVAGASASAAGLPPLATLAATAAGMALPYAEIVAHRVFDEFKSDARARVDEMLAAADHELGGGGPEALADLASKSDQTRLLTAMAVDAAARTAWPARVVALGRVLAAGLIAEDEAKIDEQQLALSAMADMERPHVNLLDLLVNRVPEWTGPVSWAAEPYARPSAPLGWQVGQRRWTVLQIVSARPSLSPVVTSLLGTLQRHGLAVQNDNTAEAIENYSKFTAEDIERRTRRGGGGMPPIPAAPKKLTPSDRMRIAPETSWSPTELGERVLGYYRLAAAEFDAAPAEPCTGN